MDKSTPPVPPTRVGVLFVHGIGDQQQGDTLLRFGEPMYRWLKQWVEGAADPAAGDVTEVTVSDTTLLRPVEAGEPPSMRLRASLLRKEKSSGSLDWLVAESWWAKSFAEPTFGAVAKWALIFGPWLIERHYDFRLFRAASLAESIRKDQRTWNFLETTLAPGTPLAPETMGKLALKGLVFAFSFVRRLLAYTLSAVVGTLAALLVAALVLLGPVPRLRKLVIGVQRMLARSIGDSYVLVSSAVRFDAMVSQVQRDMRWLAARCDRVVVVAHSQGAAVCHRALRGQRPKQVNLFVTVGSGISKLRAAEIALEHQFRTGLSVGIRFAAIAVAVIAVLCAQAAASLLVWGGLAAGAVVLFVLSRLASVGVPSTVPTDELKVDGLGAADGLKWIDFYGSADPVPEGSPFSEPLIGVESRVLHNKRSTVADHTSYWQNEELLSSLCVKLASLCSWPQFGELTDRDWSNLRDVHGERSLRTGYLMFGRWLTAATSVLVALWLTPTARETIARTVREVVAYVPGLFSASFARTIDNLLKQPPGSLLIAYIALAAGAAVVYVVVVVPIWSHWEFMATRRLFDRRPGSDHRLFLKLTLAVLTICAVVLLAQKLALLGVEFQIAAYVFGILCLAVVLIGDDNIAKKKISVSLVRVAAVGSQAPETGQPVPLGERFAKEHYLGLRVIDGVTWICCEPDRQILRIDSSRTPGVAVFRVPSGPRSLAVGFGGVWVALENGVCRMNPDTGEVEVEALLDSGCAGIAVTANAVWATSPTTNSVFRLNPETGSVEDRVAVEQEPTGLVATGGHIWVNNLRSGSVSKIDCATNKVLGTASLSGGGFPWGWPLVANGSVWVMNLKGGLSRIDRDQLDVHRDVRGAKGGWIGGLTASDGFLVIGDERGRKVWRLADSGEPVEIRLPLHPREVAADATGLWIIGRNSAVLRWRRRPAPTQHQRLQQLESVLHQEDTGPI